MPSFMALHGASTIQLTNFSAYTVLIGVCGSQPTQAKQRPMGEEQATIKGRAEQKKSLMYTDLSGYSSFEGFISIFLPN